LGFTRKGGIKWEKKRHVRDKGRRKKGYKGVRAIQREFWRRSPKQNSLD